MERFPKASQNFEKQFPHILKELQEVVNICHGAGPLDEKTRRLVKLGIAIGTKSEVAVKSHVKKAIKADISVDEIRHVVLLATTTIGFPEMFTASYWVDETLTQGD